MINSIVSFNKQKVFYIFRILIAIILGSLLLATSVYAASSAFGYYNGGNHGTNMQNFNSTYFIGKSYNLPVAGTITSVSGYFANTSAASGHVMFAICNSSGSLVATTSAVTIPNGSGNYGWYSANVIGGGTLTAGNYYICLQTDISGYNLFIYYDKDTSQEYAFPNTYGSFPNAASFTSGNNWVINENFSLYATCSSDSNAAATSPVTTAPSETVSGNSYYVATTGNDSNPGT